MASFDFIGAAAKGYEFVWNERAYLARVAIPVVFVKVACLLTVFVLGAQELYLRQGLILLPGHVVEAIFTIGLIRYMLYGEPIFIWGKVVTPPKPDKEITPYRGRMSRARCVQGAIIMFILLKVIEVGISAWVLDNVVIPSGPVVAEAAEVEMLHPFLNAMILFSALMFFIWVFRMFWLFIPIAMGYSFVHFLKKIEGQQSSILMIATWLVCFLPLVVFFVGGIHFVSGVFPDGSAVNIIATAVLKAIAEVVIISIQAVAMTCGIAEMLSSKSGRGT